MKLWLLRPVDKRASDDDPWTPWYDKTYGFIIRAENEATARDMAHAKAGDENESQASTREPWKDAKYSTCVELLPEGSPGIVMEDYASGG